MSSSLRDNSLSVAPLETLPEGIQASTADKNTYGQILKSSVLIGGSSAVNVVIGMVRTKVFAVLLGPAGFGLFGLYQSIANLTQSIAGMGINSSGVRQIAQAVGTDDTERIAQTTTVLRRTSIVLGLLGAGFLLLFSRQASKLTFGNPEHAGAMSLLAVSVFFQLISWGQAALIQGMRRIADLAKMGVLGTLSGTLIAIPMVYFLREKGVVPSLVCISLMSLAFSYWYSRKIHILTPSMTASQIGQEATALLKLGFAFMASYFMTTGIAYTVRIILLRKVGLDATGFYQSAWTLGGLYVGFILQAMGADFFPRLTACAHDNPACNRLVNEQARVGMLLAGPGVIATLTFAPVVITLFYTAKFGAAVVILRWICLGTAVQVITWPMGFINIAKGKQGIFFATELAWTVISIGFAWESVSLWGLNGAGVAFFGSCVLHGFLLYPIVHWVSDFRWSSANKRTALLFFSLITIAFAGFYFLTLLQAVCVGTVAALLAGVYSIRVLSTFISRDRFPRPVRQLLAWLRLIPPDQPNV